MIEITGMTSAAKAQVEGDTGVETETRRPNTSCVPLHLLLTNSHRSNVISLKNRSVSTLLLLGTNILDWIFLFRLTDLRRKAGLFLLTCCTMNSFKRNWSSCSTTWSTAPFKIWHGILTNSRFKDLTLLTGLLRFWEHKNSISPHCLQELFAWIYCLPISYKMFWSTWRAAVLVRYLVEMRAT